MKTEFTVLMVLHTDSDPRARTILLQRVHEGQVLPITEATLLAPAEDWGGEKPKRVFYYPCSETLTVELRDFVFREEDRYTDAISDLSAAGWGPYRPKAKEEAPDLYSNPVAPEYFEALQDLLSLVMDSSPSLAVICSWTDAQRTEARDWAEACHLRASDHVDVQVPTMPRFLKRLRRKMPFGGELDIDGLVEP